MDRYHMKYFVELSDRYSMAPCGELHVIRNHFMGEYFRDVNGDIRDISDWEDQSGYVVWGL